ncbi:hypothetical protein KJ671_00720 [Patescibacteria group bacterium]|nr:hypothetical protein [Patescibacteria group bacterium]
MKKITLNKSDEVALIVEKIIDVDFKKVVLIIPRFSSLAESLSNFHLLKREADALDKEIFIESVDNRVIELAELAGIEALNPFFVKNKRQFSDIVPKKRKTKKIETSSWEESFMENLTDNLYDQKDEVDNHNIERKKVFEKEKEYKPIKKIFSFEKIPTKTISTLIVSCLIIYIAVAILPKADLKIITKKVEWTYNDSIITKTSAKIDYKNLIIPNQVFTQTNNTTMYFSATGKKEVKDKASGVITIYNSYSSSPQTLVINTRFLSPEGKLFLLTKTIVVPGAKISEGKIIPSSIDADVVADEAGEDYNIGPVKLFSIPGFKGGPKYDAFYGESKDNMIGGFVGEVSYPTSSDISVASKKIKETLESNLKNTLYSQIPDDFKILEGASSFSILNQDIKEAVDENNKFSIFGEGELVIIAFNEADLMDILTKNAEEENKDLYQLKDYDLEYGIARMDVDSGRLSFPIDFKSVLSYKIDVENLKKEIIGKSDIDLRKAIFSLSGLDTANVSLWPFWVKNVPAKLNKINIVID